MTTRRGFLKSVAAAAVAIPLAPLALPPHAAATRMLANYRLHSIAVVKASAWIPVTDELLADGTYIRSFVDQRLAAAFRAEFDDLLNGED